MENKRRMSVRYGEFLMRAIISLVVLLVSIVVILSGGYEKTTENFAYMTIGTVIGYWLRDGNVFPKEQTLPTPR
jgi:putative flippase GtrA